MMITPSPNLPLAPLLGEACQGRRVLDDRILQKHKLTRGDYEAVTKLLGRSPTWTELGVVSALWSEHCSYKSSRLHLARLPSSGPGVVVPPGENAGVVRIQGKLCVAFKMESHNHPSYIDPYQGAATGVGGILRDVFCMGARPLCNLNALRFGEPTHPRTPYLLGGVVRGIGDYGNCVGVPTVGGSVSYDASYNGNILVNAMTVGLIDEERIFTGHASGVGNLVVYVGAATGRDGIHGATMASDSFAAAAEEERGAVQVGDPFYEKLLLEATLEALNEDLVVGIQDMGAAGLTSSLFEMAERAASGLFIDLDAVPTRSPGMSAYELMLSESQERMAMVVKPEHWPRLQGIFARWQLAHSIIGEVTTSGRLQASYGNKLEIDIAIAPFAAITPRYDRPRQARPLPTEDHAFTAHCLAAFARIGWQNLLQGMLARGGTPDAIYKQFDHHIGRASCWGPDGGGAAVLWLRSPLSQAEAPYLGLVAASSGLEKLCRLHPRHGAALTVAKAARMIAASGGKPLAITDCLNFGNPENPEVMWEFSEAVTGLKDACEALEVPVVSGNVSFYNETDGRSIAPTPMIGMVGRCPDVRQSKGAIARRPGSLWLLGPRDKKAPLWLGGSLAVEALGLPLEEGVVPAPLWEAEKEAATFLQALAQHSEEVVARRDIGAGGLVITALKMGLPQGLGLSLNPPPGDENPFLYFVGQRMASYLVVCRGELATTPPAAAADLRYCSWQQVGELHATDCRVRLGPTSLAREPLLVALGAMSAAMANPSAGA